MSSQTDESLARCPVVLSLLKLSEALQSMPLYISSSLNALTTRNSLKVHSSTKRIHATRFPMVAVFLT